MKVYQIEVDDTLNHILEEAARIMDVNIESFITEILNRYALDPHIMEKEDVKRWAISISKSAIDKR